MLKRGITFAIVALAGYLAYPVAANLFPPVSVTFWRLANCGSIKYDDVRVGQYCALASSPSAHISFRLLFAIGTREAQLYALAGIRRFEGELAFARCAEDLSLQGGNVRVIIGDTSSYSSVESWINVVRRGDLPIGRGGGLPNKSLQPTPTAVMPPAAQEIMPAAGVVEH
jgi:hypothetical protein